MPRTTNGYDVGTLPPLFSPPSARGTLTIVSDVEVLQSPFSTGSTGQPLRPSSVWAAVASLVIVLFVAQCFHSTWKRGVSPRVRRRLAGWGHGGGEGRNEQQQYDELPAGCGQVMTGGQMQGHSTSAQQQQPFVLGHSAPPQGHLPEDVSQLRKRKTQTHSVETSAEGEEGAQPTGAKRFFQGPTQQHPMQPSASYLEAIRGHQMSSLRLLNWSPSGQTPKTPYLAQVLTPQAPRNWAGMAAGVAPDGGPSAPPVALPLQQSFDQSQIPQGGSLPFFQASPRPFPPHQIYEGPQPNVYWAPLASAQQGVDLSVQQQGMMLHPSAPALPVATQVSAASSSMLDEIEYRYSVYATGQTETVDPETQRLIDIYLGDELGPQAVSSIQVSWTPEETSRSTVPQLSSKPRFSPAAAAPTALSSSFNVADQQGCSGVPCPYSAAFPRQHQSFAEARAVDPSASTERGQDPRQFYQGELLGSQQGAGGPSASMAGGMDLRQFYGEEALSTEQGAIDPSASMAGGVDPRQLHEGVLLGIEQGAGGPSASTAGDVDPGQSYHGVPLGAEQVAGGSSASMEDYNPHQAATGYFVQQGPTDVNPSGDVVQQERWSVEVGSFHDDACGLLCSHQQQKDSIEGRVAYPAKAENNLPFQVSDDPKYLTHDLYRLPPLYEGEQLKSFSHVSSFDRVSKLIYVVHKIFVKTSLSKEEAQKLISKAAELFAYSLKCLKGDLEGGDVENAVEGLARRFLVLDAMWSIGAVVGEAADKGTWWRAAVKALIGRLEDWEAKFEKKHKQSRSKMRHLIPMLVLALRALKAGARPAPQFVVEIKKRLFGEHAPAYFRTREWNKMRRLVEVSGFKADESTDASSSVK